MEPSDQSSRDDLAELVAAAQSKDVRERCRAVQAAQEWVHTREALAPAAAASLIEAIRPALADSSPKVVQGALELAGTLVERLGDTLSPHFSGLWAPILERLGDAKPSLRERAVELAVSGATLAVPTAEALDALRPGFEHRNWRTRESCLLVLARTLAALEAGGASLSLRPYVPLCARLLEDGAPSVREAAALAFEHVHRHRGEALLAEMRRLELRPQVLRQILARLGDEAEGAEAGPAQGTPSPVAPPSSGRRRPASAGRARSSGGALEQEGGGEVRPVAVGSERELGREMDALGQQLRNEEDWAARLKALQRLRGLAAGGACGLGSFGERLRALRDPLTAQCGELRSSLVKEACRALVAISGAMRDAFEPFVDVYLPPLLKNTVVTIAVISQSSHAAVLAILMATPTPRALPRLLGGMGDRSATMRSRCTEYLTRLLQRLPAASAGAERSPLERHLDAICLALRAALSDALSDVRAHARCAFWALHRHAEPRAARLLAGLEEQIGRLLLEEREAAQAGYEGQLAALDPLSPAHAAALLAPPTSRPRSSSPHQRTPAASAPTDESPAPLRRAPSPGPRVGSLVGALAAAAPPAAAPPAAASPAAVSSAARPRATSARPPARAPQQGARPASCGGGRVVAQAEPLMSEGARRVGRPGSSAGPSSSYAERGRRAADEGACVNGGAEAEGREAEAQGGDGGRRLPTESVATLLCAAASPVWSVRVGACSDLEALLRSGRASEAVALLDRLAAVSIERLVDPHHKVVHAALRLVDALLSTYPQAFDPLVERLLPLLLARLHEARPALRDAAALALDSLCAALPPEALFPMLLRMLDIQAPKVRTSALLIISEVAPAAAHLLAAGVHMRPAVQKVLPLAAEKQPELRRAAIDAMLALHAAAPPTFLAQAGQLPLAAQHQLRSLVAADAPELAAQLATARPVARRSTQPEQPRQARPGGGSGLGGTPERGGGTPERGAGCGNESRGGGSESRGGGCRGALDTPPRETSLSGGRAGGGASGGPLREIRPAAKQQDTAHAGALELSGGNEDWLLLMPTLLRALQGGQPEASQREALVKLHKMVLVVRPGAPVWDRHWEHALEAVLRAVQHEGDAMREPALACLKDMLRTHSGRFGAFTEHVLLRLLAAAHACAPSREVAASAEEALELLLSISDPHRCIAVLVPVLVNEPPPTLQLAIRLQSKLVGRFSQLQLLSILPQLLPPLFEAFKNAHADVRKAVVFCLVDMYLVLGEQLTPHLATLSTAQLKLVTIYINKTTKARADRLDAPHI